MTTRKRKNVKKQGTKRKKRETNKSPSLKENSNNFLEFRSTKASLSTTDYADDVNGHVKSAQPIASLVLTEPSKQRQENDRKTR